MSPRAGEMYVTASLFEIRLMAHGRLCLLTPLPFSFRSSPFSHLVPLNSSFDFVSFASPACLGIRVTFYSQILSIVFGSALLLFAPYLSLLRVLRKPEKLNKEKLIRLRDMFLIVVLLHPTVSGLMFRFFNCDIIDTTGASGGNSTANSTGGAVAVTYYLREDYSLKCFDKAWYQMLPVVIAVIVLFSIGMPLFFSYLLWKRRDTLRDKKTMKLIGILYKVSERWGEGPSGGVRIAFILST